MTTVACDGRSIAGDGMLTDDNIVCSLDAQKVRKLPDGRLVGFCGNAYNYEPFAAWLEAGAEGEPPKVPDGIGCMVLYPDGHIVTYDEHGRPFNEKDKWAIGSGQRFALAAMDLGKNAEEAVVYAATRDVFTGGVITAISLNTELREVA